MLERQESGAGTRGIAADAQVFGCMFVQGVEPLEQSLAITRVRCPYGSKSLGLRWQTRQSRSCVSSAMLFCSPCAGVLVARSLDPPDFPQFARLAANLAGLEG